MNRTWTYVLIAAALAAVLALYQAQRDTGGEPKSETEGAAEAGDSADSSASAPAPAAEDAAAAIADAISGVAGDANEVRDEGEGPSEASGAAANIGSQVARDVIAASRKRAEVPDALTVEGFDLEKALDLVAAAPIADATKNGLLTALRAAAENAEELGKTLDTVRTALGF